MFMVTQALQARHSRPPSAPETFHRPFSAKHLPSLPLVCLSILEWEPTRPLIRTSLPADPAVATSEQDAPQRDRGQETRTKCTQAKRHDSSLGPHGVSIKGISGVEHGGYGKGWQCVWCFWILGLGCCACSKLDEVHTVITYEAWRGTHLLRDDLITAQSL